jgi:iron-sulfur cluster repair protein YtfE (RIC family)
MCQNCGCLANTVIDELTREHDAVVGLIRTVGELVVAGRLGDVAATCRAISALLGPHIIVEEEGLFPELFREFPGQLEELTREHRQVERVLGEAADGVPADLLWTERLRDCLGTLREHILKEQDGVFPAAIISLDGDQWEIVERVRWRAGSCLDGRPSGDADGRPSGDADGRAGHEMLTRSTTKTSVSFGPIAGGAPRVP